MEDRAGKKMSRKEISSRGGLAAHANGVAHTWTEEEASLAGKIGGRAVLRKYGPEHFARLGKLGAAARQAARASRGGRY